jgi:hypothetical protein
VYLFSSKKFLPNGAVVYVVSMSGQSVARWRCMTRLGPKGGDVGALGSELFCLFYRWFFSFYLSGPVPYSATRLFVLIDREIRSGSIVLFKYCTQLPTSVLTSLGKQPSQKKKSLAGSATRRPPIAKGFKCLSTGSATRRPPIVR